MTLQEFSNASYYVQKTMVKFHGTLLLTKSTATLVEQLYQLDGFYVELTYASEPNSPPLIQSHSIEDIDKYLSFIDISTISRLL